MALKAMSVAYFRLLKGLRSSTRVTMPGLFCSNANSFESMGFGTIEEPQNGYRTSVCATRLIHWETNSTDKLVRRFKVKNRRRAALTRDILRYFQRIIEGNIVQPSSPRECFEPMYPDDRGYFRETPKNPYT